MLQKSRFKRSVRMNKDSFGKKSLKKVLIASMFTSAVLGAEKTLAVEDEPDLLNIEDSVKGYSDSKENTFSILKELDVSEDTMSALHKAIQFHINEDYKKAESLYSSLLENEEVNEVVTDVLNIFLGLAESQINLDEETILEIDGQNEILSKLIEAFKNDELVTTDEDIAQDESNQADVFESNVDDEPDQIENTDSTSDSIEKDNAVSNKDVQGNLKDDSSTSEIDKKADKITPEEEDIESSTELPNDEETKNESDSDMNTKVTEERSFSMFSVAKSPTVPNANLLFSQSNDASTASDSWDYAIEFLKHYPNDYRINEVFDNASSRVFALAQSHHRNRNFNNGIYYYRLLENQKHVPVEIQNSLSTLIDKASNSVRLSYSSSYYTNVIEASTATNAWNAAMEFKTTYPTDNRLNEAIASAANRIFSMGRSRHRANDFNNALYYYDLLISEPLVNQDLQNNALIYLSEIRNELNTSQDDLFHNVINARTSTEAWNNLEKLIARFPKYTRMNEAVSHASSRVYAMGRSNHISGNSGNALTYYQWLLNQNKVEESLRNTVSAHVYQLDNGLEYRTVEDYVKDTSNAPTATEAWNIATEANSVFPGNKEVLSALNSAAGRTFSLGKSNHKRGNLSSAILYYDRVITQEGIHSSMKNEAEAFKNQAVNNLPFTTAADFYNESMNANTASNAWSKANEGLHYFNNDSNILKALQAAADRVAALGESNHLKGNFSTATVYYNRLLNNDLISSRLRTRVDDYEYLASNKLYLTNTIVKESSYSSSFEQAVNKQMSLKYAKPQASHNGSWRDATKEEVMHYMDPKNSLPSDMSDLTSLFNTAKIKVSALNVRTGPSTDYEKIGTVTKGQEFTIIEEQNGWYRIGFNGRDAWISGSTSHVDRNNDMLQHLVLTGSSGISIANLNHELKGAGILDGQGEAFHKASREANINEIYLISHAFLETGRGTSTLATGVLVEEVNGEKVKPRVVYNMYGIGAVDEAPIKKGSERAYQEGWFTPEASIIGGSKWISESYVNHSRYNQNTLYKMRWNPATPGAHQYATDIGWAYKQTNMLKSIISYSQKDNLILNFEIPKY